MPDEAAVLDAPAVDAGVTEDVSSTVDSGIVDPGSNDGANAEVIDNNDSPQAGETGHLRGAELYRAVKDKLRNGEKLSPQEQRSIRNAIHIAAKADEATGGDLTRFEAERQAYSQLALPGEESLPPEDLVETVRGDREQLQGIIADIEAGAPRLIEEMIADHPESFKSLVPQAMDRLAQLDNERFSNYVARSAVNYLNSSGLPVEFAVLEEFLPSMPDFPGKNRLIQAIQKVYGAFNGLETMAAKQLADPERKEGVADADSSAQDLSQREMNVTRYEWNRTAAHPNVQLRDAEMARIAGSRKIALTEQEKTEIKAGIKDEFEARLAANVRYGEAMQGYLRNGNQRAYAERAASEGKKLLPSIVARHVNAVLDKRTATKPGAKTNSAGARMNMPSQPVKDGNGNLIQWLSGPPRSLGKQVDYMRTTNSMLQRNEAYLKGEKGLFKWKVKTA